MEYLNAIGQSNKLTLYLMLVVLYKQLNCAANKTIDACHTASTDCNY